MKDNSGRAKIERALLNIFINPGMLAWSPVGLDVVAFAISEVGNLRSCFVLNVSPGNGMLKGLSKGQWT
jgi:hypothetical protein